MNNLTGSVDRIKCFELQLFIFLFFEAQRQLVPLVNDYSQASQSGHIDQAAWKYPLFPFKIKQVPADAPSCCDRFISHRMSNVLSK